MEKPTLTDLKNSGAVFPASQAPSPATKTGALVENRREQVRVFSLTSKAFTGEVIFEFRNGLLEKFDMSGAELNEKQHTTLARNLPRTTEEAQAFMSKSNNAIFTEIVQTVTFNMFWNCYDDKFNSSKKKTEIKWDKMPVAEQLKAYRYINRYFASIPSGTRKKYAETYLNAELWNN